MCESWSTYWQSLQEINGCLNLRFDDVNLSVYMPGKPKCRSWGKQSWSIRLHIGYAGSSCWKERSRTQLINHRKPVMAKLILESYIIQSYPIKFITYIHTYKYIWTWVYCNHCFQLMLSYYIYIYISCLLWIINAGVLPVKGILILLFWWMD